MLVVYVYVVARMSDDPAIVRAPDGKWLPGTASPNAGGKPKLAREFHAALRDKCYPKVIGILEDGLGSEDLKFKMWAAEQVMDRLFGKASQPITGENGSPVDVTVGLYALFKKLSGEEGDK